MTLFLETTGIGSLPFIDYKQAVDHVFENYTIPFFPQLVRHARFSKILAPQMLQEVIPELILEKLLIGKKPDIDLWDQLLDEHLHSLPGIESFRKQLLSANQAYFKIQLAGPQSVISMLEHIMKKKFSKTWTDYISEKVLKMSQKMTMFFSSIDKKCIFIWDEGLPLSDWSEERDQQLSKTLSATESASVITGVHCCAPFRLGTFLKHAPNRYLAPDVNLLAGSGREIQDLLTTGGLIAGIIDTQNEEIDLDQASDSLKRVLVGSDSEPYKPQIPFILSGACGTGLHTIQFEQSLASALKKIAVVT